MYCVTLEHNLKILQVSSDNRKKFVVNGEFVKIPKSGVVVFPENTEIIVCKILHHVFQQVSMAKNKSILYNNSVEKQAEMRAEKFGLPYTKRPEMQLAENEILWCSLEPEEKI
jgi:hypothetical protein